MDMLSKRPQDMNDGRHLNVMVVHVRGKPLDSHMRLIILRVFL